MKKVLRTLALALVALILGAGILASCSKAASADNGYYYPSYGDGAYYGEIRDAVYGSNGTWTSPSDASGLTVDRMIVKTAQIDTEIKGMSAFIDKLKEKCTALSGYVASEYAYEKNARIIFRIPVDKFDEFLTYVKANSNVLSSSSDAVDVTDKYVDLTNHIDNLEAHLAALRGLYDKTDNISEMLNIGRQITDTTTELEGYKKQRDGLVGQATYSLAAVYLHDVETLTAPAPEKGAGERMGEGFVNSIKSVGRGFREFFVWFVVALPYLAVLAVFVGGITAITVFLIKRENKKSAKKRAVWEEAQRQNAEARRKYEESQRSGGSPQNK